MQYAIVSDIHANMQAWNAVLLDIRSQGIESILCLGDIVGYGPNPAEVLQSVHSSVEYLALGNHDAVICGKMDPSLFNDDARTIIKWTQRHLGPNAMKFLKTLPLTLDGGGFRCAHGEFSNPAAFDYVIDPADALPSWQAVPEQILFIGHTHKPGIFLVGESGEPHLIDAQDFEIEPEKRYLVNVGSVGQPRDDDARASYCVYDKESQAVYWRRIPFDIDAYRSALDKAGIPARPSYFLRHDPRRGAPPIRELLSFSPPTTRDKEVQNTVEVRELRALKRNVRKWKLLFVCLLAIGASIAALAGTAWYRYSHRALTIQGGTAPSANLASHAAEENILSLPTAQVKPNSPIPGWTVFLGNRHRQCVAFVPSGDHGPSFALHSESAADSMRISSPAISAPAGTKLRAEAFFRTDPSFSGETAMVISLTRTNGTRKETVDDYLIKGPSLSRKGGWMLARQTFTLPVNSDSVVFSIKGRFAGNARVSGMSLCRAE